MKIESVNQFGSEFTYIECRPVFTKCTIVPDGNVYFNSIGHKAYLVSDTEPITCGTEYWNPASKTIEQCKDNYEEKIVKNFKGCKKVVVFPDELPKSLLEDFASCKITEEDKVLLNCEYSNGGYSNTDSPPPFQIQVKEGKVVVLSFVSFRAPLVDKMQEAIFVKTGGREENPQIAKICADIALVEITQFMKERDYWWKLSELYKELSRYDPHTLKRDEVNDKIRRHLQ